MSINMIFSRVMLNQRISKNLDAKPGRREMRPFTARISKAGKRARRADFCQRPCIFQTNWISAWIRLKTRCFRMILYQLFESPTELSLREGKKAFGIQCEKVEDGKAALLQAIGDISTSRQRVDTLAERCTRAQLSPLHFRDVVDDFLLA